MKETGIIMSGNHPKLVIDGTKTMTRRVIKPQPKLIAGDGTLGVYEYKGYLATQGNIADEFTQRSLCLYGQVGDRLWVRETWRVESFLEGEPMLFGYKDGQTMEENEYSDTLDYESWNERVCIQSTEDAEKAFKQGLVRQSVDGMYRWDIGKSPCRWRPSIHMPRWASRITLEITEVRVERVQEITEEDVRAEGFDVHIDWGSKWFVNTWDSLNAKRGYGWEVNPWVWVIWFKVLQSEK